MVAQRLALASAERADLTNLYVIVAQSCQIRKGFLLVPIFSSMIQNQAGPSDMQ